MSVEPVTSRAINSSRESDTQSVVLFLSRDDLPRVTLCMLRDDVTDFVTLTEGYYRLYVEKNGTLLKGDSKKTVNNNINTGKLLAFVLTIVEYFLRFFFQ